MNFRYWPHAALVLILAGAAWRGYTNRFITDDGYIALTYARNFAVGHGLVWYPGFTEFGYTSFLYTFLAGCLIKLGLAPEAASYAITIPSFLASICVVFLIGQRAALPVFATVIACLGLATNPSFNTFAAGGLETSLHAFLVISAYALMLQRRFLMLGIVSSLVLLTRLDSALLLLPIYLLLALQWKYNREETQRVIMQATLPPVLSVMALLAFCKIYYGYALPSSFYAKIDHRPHFLQGWIYIAAFLGSQAFMPVFLAAWGVIGRRKLTIGALHILIYPIGVWLAYILYIGGDFMEFRFLVPLLPLYYLFFAALLCNISYPKTAWLVLLLFLIGNATQHYAFNRTMSFRNISSPNLLRHWVRGGPVNWVDTGKALYRLFYTGQSVDPKIALTAAGAIPFYSGLPAIDMHGLNTRDILFDTDSRRSPRPGHFFFASAKYLSRTDANLVIGHPSFYVEKNGQYFCLPSPAHRGEANLLIPVKGRFYLLAYYHAPHPAVERHIAEGTILRMQDLGKKIRCR